MRRGENMNYHNITKTDLKNGDGLRVVLWVAGCNHRCKDCQNPETWDSCGGLHFDDLAKQEIFDELDKDYISGITFRGGDPLYENNLDEVLKLVQQIRISFPEKTIWLYTGFRWNYIMHYQPVETDDFDYIEESYNDGLMEKRKQIISLCNVIVDGEYIDEQRDITLKWRGSKNQHVIDVRKSLARNKIVLYCD